jgi:uncharacterized protein YgiM (DUF1202 family)
MNSKLLNKIFITVILGVVTLLLPLSSVVSYQSIERESLGFDETLAVDTDPEYAYPEKILLTKVTTPNSELEADPESWSKLIYYYYITRLGFGEIPYNYLLDKEGNIYDMREGYDGVVPELKEFEGVVIVGYLSNGSEITQSAGLALSEFIEEYSFRYGIESKEIAAVETSVAEKEDENSLSLIEYNADNSYLSQELAAIKNSTKFYDEGNLDLTAEVLSVDAPDSVKVGQQFNVTVEFENNSEYPWFTQNDFFYLVTADSEDSEFAVNGVWDSFDTVTEISEGTVMPGTNYSLEFPMRAMKLPGDYSQRFKLTRLYGGEIEGSQFDVSLSVEQSSDIQLLKIKETDTGYLNVRSAPSFSGEVIRQVDVGSKWVTTDQQGGWYKISLNDEVDGWVYAQYIELL